MGEQKTKLQNKSVTRSQSIVKHSTAKRSRVKVDNKTDHSNQLSKRVKLSSSEDKQNDTVVSININELENSSDQNFLISLKLNSQKIDFPGQTSNKSKKQKQNVVDPSTRKSSRLSKNNNAGQPIYILDKMNQKEYQEQMLIREIQQNEEKLMKYAIQQSIVMETKYKNRKQSKQWYKNFLKESDCVAPKQIKSQATQEETPFKKKRESKRGKKLMNSNDSQNSQESVESEFQLTEGHFKQASEDTDTPIKNAKQECQDELEELLRPSIKKDDSDTFLKPLPIAKQKVEQQEKTKFTQQAINPMDLSIRKEFTSFSKFEDFQKQNAANSNYGPALIQKMQEGADIVSSRQTEASSSYSQITMSPAKPGQDKSKNHFIRQKQSHCNIKRQCGVSYVKKTESKQENVRGRGYEKLPPIVIQGSYTLPAYDGSFDEAQVDSNVQNVIKNLFSSKDKVFLISAFESFNEVEMKNYLLKPHKRLDCAQGKYWLVKEPLNNLWKFVKDKYFMCIHFKYDKDSLMQTINLQNQDEEVDYDKIKQFIETSDVCLGFLPKKGNASVKSMLKVYKLQDHYLNRKATSEETCRLMKCLDTNIQGVNTIAYLSRLELFLPQHQWKNCPLRMQTAFTAFINQLEDQMGQVLLNWNQSRTNVHKQGDNEPSQIMKIEFKSFEKSQKNQNQILWENLEDGFGKEIKCDNQIEWKENIEDPVDIMSNLRKTIPVPVTLINTRDCFAYDLKFTEEIIDAGEGRTKIIKKEYYFDPAIVNGYPANLKQVLGLKPDADMTDINNLKVGVTSYENFYTAQEMDEMESLVEETEQESLRDNYLPMTAQKTYTGTTLKRTKFFFGYRYMWTRTQLQDPLANVAGGVRGDVSQPPLWMKNKLEEPLVRGGIIDKDFVNSVALNVYHDGSEGLAQHFDDATRFKQPIYTLRLFSDSRLSFGSQYYGFQNSAFYIPLPRGCICKMEEGSYSANGVKHCVRPCDMTGKSSAIILRQMHPNVVEEATKLDRNIDLPMWLSTLSLNEKSVPFYQQKDHEYEWLEKGINQCQKIAGQNQRRDNTTNSTPVQKLMNDMINRVVVKSREETSITQKIAQMRMKLRSSEKQTVQLFKTDRIREPIS